MAQLLIREISADLIEALAARAAANGRSVEAEHRAILEEALTGEGREFRARAARLRVAMAGTVYGDSVDLIRADRDAR
jgi:plasmid stability protein